MVLRVKYIVGVLLLLTLGGLFLRLTVFLPGDTYDPTLPRNDILEELRVKQAQKLQSQLDKIKELEEKLVSQAQELAQKKQEKEEFAQREADLVEKHDRLEQERDQEKERIKEHQEALDQALQEKNRLEAAVIAREREIQEDAALDEEWELSRSKKVELWSASTVIQWARRVCKLEPKDLHTLTKMEIFGSDLVGLTKNNFLDAGITRDGAIKIADCIFKLANPEPETEPESSTPKKVKRTPTIAVVGAGFAGIGTTREIAENGGIPILIEEAKKPGGIWIYDPDPTTVSGYHSLFAQGAPADVNLRGWVIPPDAPRTLSIHDITKHLTSFWDKFGLGKYATYNKHVTNVETRFPKETTWKNWMDIVNEGKKLLRVHYEETMRIEMAIPSPGSEGNNSTVPTAAVLVNLTKTKNGYYDVDGVVVCVGRNHVPTWPSTKPEAAGKFIPGYAEFTGISMHSSQYRLPSQFPLNTTVIVSGGGKSGQDIYADLVASKQVTAYHASSQSTGTRNRIRNITQENDGTFTVYFETSQKGDKSEPVRNVGGIIWCWGFQWLELSVNGSQSQGQGFYNDVIYKGYPGITRVGTQGVLASSRAQAVYVGRVLTGRIPLPDVTDPEWSVVSNWNGVGRDQYLWHELTSY